MRRMWLVPRSLSSFAVCAAQDDGRCVRARTSRNGALRSYDPNHQDRSRELQVDAIRSARQRGIALHIHTWPSVRAFTMPRTTSESVRSSRGMCVDGQVRKSQSTPASKTSCATSRAIASRRARQTTRRESKTTIGSEPPAVTPGRRIRLGIVRGSTPRRGQLFPVLRLVTGTGSSARCSSHPCRGTPSPPSCLLP